MLILIILLGAGFGYLILNQNKKTTTTTTSAPEATVTEVPDLTYLITNDFVVNLSDADAKRLVKLNITLGFTSSKLEVELKTKDSFIKDTVNSVLREKKAADFSTPQGTDALKKEFMTRINPYLKAGKISAIYFNNILVQ